MYTEVSNFNLGTGEIRSQVTEPIISLRFKGLSGTATVLHRYVVYHRRMIRPVIQFMVFW